MRPGRLQREKSRAVGDGEPEKKTPAVSPDLSNLLSSGALAVSLTRRGASINGVIWQSIHVQLSTRSIASFIDGRSLNFNGISNVVIRRPSPNNKYQEWL
jgi:hypothetical protein